MELSNDQQIAFALYKQGHNVFITGPGGSGKSELIRLIHQHARKRYKRIYVTAMTGCAAVLLSDEKTKCNPSTLHSWSGIGLGNEPVEDIVKNIRDRQYLLEKWIDVNILVVDEVRMLSMKLFKLLNNLT